MSVESMEAMWDFSLVHQWAKEIDREKSENDHRHQKQQRREKELTAFDGGEVGLEVVGAGAGMHPLPPSQAHALRSHSLFFFPAHRSSRFRVNKPCSSAAAASSPH